MKHKTWRKALSLALALMLVVSMVPGAAFAAAGTPDGASSSVSQTGDSGDSTATGDSSQAGDTTPAGDDSEAGATMPTGDPTGPVVTLSGSVDYLDEKGNSQTLTENWTAVTADLLAWTDGWYVVTGEVTIAGRVTVNGDVKLILADGANLTVNGASTWKRASSSPYMPSPPATPWAP